MAFLATLATTVATVAESGVIVAGDDEYHPLSVDGSMHAWLSEHAHARFSWRTPAAPLSAQACAAIAAKFMPKRLLANFDLRAVLMMYEAINPKTTMNGVESTLARVVRQAVQSVLEHYKSKQAGTFQQETNATGVSADEAGKLASKLISAANPTILANPLETPAATAPKIVLPTAAADAPTNVQNANAPEATRPAGEPYRAAPAQIAAASTTATSQSYTGDGNEAEEKLSRGHKVLREWFSALKQHPQFPVLKDQLVMSDEGIEVPVSMLGMFGVSGATVRKMMDEAGLILGRTTNARGVILHAGLRSRFINQ